MGTEFIRPISADLAPERFAPLRITPLMPGFAARVDGLDLSDDLGDEIESKLREAYLHYGVLFFGGQGKLSSDRQLELAAVFGEPDFGSPFVEKLNSQIDLLTTDQNRPPVTNLWHSDNTALPIPSLGTLIQIQTGPAVGGNTAWSCTRKAYECLSRQMKTYIDDLVAIHYWDGRGQREGHYLSQRYEELDKYIDRIRKYPPREHRIAFDHPITGEKSLFVNETFTTFVKGLHKYESKAILDFLFSWIRMPEFCIFNHWQKNDVAVWDNFAMQHYALADYTETRVNQRVTFAASPSERYNYGAAISELAALSA